jgi:hypothetical protein
MRLLQDVRCTHRSQGVWVLRVASYTLRAFVTPTPTFQTPSKGGQIIDATIVPVPIQRNSRDENKQVKAGEIPAEWVDAPHKRAQKDTDAR